MTQKIVSEIELRKRLKEKGVKKADIDHLIGEYIDSTVVTDVDTAAISGILQKAQAESSLRVSSFKLERREYEEIVSYFQESDATRLPEEPSAEYLVRRLIKDFIDLMA